MKPPFVTNSVRFMLALFLVAGCMGQKRDNFPSGPRTASKTKRTELKATTPSSKMKATAISAKELPMIPGKPVFSVKLDFAECPHNVFVNGGIVASDTTFAPDEGEYPINQWLRSGDNTIEVRIAQWTDKPERCDVKLELIYKDADSIDKDPEGTTVLTIAYSAKAAEAGTPFLGSTPGGVFDSRRKFVAAENGDVLIGPPQIKRVNERDKFLYAIVRSVNLHLPFPEWAFFRGEPLKQDWEFENEQAFDHIYGQVLSAYRGVWKLLAARDINGFLVACEERSRETDIAYYRKPGETRASLRHLLEVAMKDKDLELAPVDLSPGRSWIYDIGSNGNPIALTQPPDSSPILRFETKKGSPYSYIFPIVFRKEGNKYIVTR